MRVIGDDPDLIEPASPRRPPWRRLLRAGLDLLLPPRCVACNVRVDAPHGLCPACWSTLDVIVRPFCERTATPFTFDPGPGVVSPEALQFALPWQAARAAVRYVGVAPDLVHALKYGDRHDVALLAGRLMARAGADVLAAADLVVPVPLHRLRLWRRRFNQAALLARAAVGKRGPPIAYDVLLRRRSTRQQVGLTRDARARNVAGAFVVPVARAPAVRGKRIVLIDDVYTTGATLAAATRVLKRAGAAWVDVLVFARAVEPIAVGAETTHMSAP